MAASLILLTPEELTKEAAALENAANQNASAMKKIDSVVNGLLSHWRGDAQTQFMAAYQKRRKTFDEMTNKLRELAKDVKEFATNMGSMENQHANIAKKL